MQRRLAIAILILGIIECLILVAIALAPAPENAAGLAHATLPGVRIGGDGTARFTPIATLSFLFQALMLVQAHLMVALGVSDRLRTLPFLGLLAGCLAISLFVWFNLFSEYQRFLETGVTSYFAGFPAATAWQVYAIWLGGLSLVALYVFGFKKFIWSDEDEQAFQQLVDESLQRGEESLQRGNDSLQRNEDSLQRVDQASDDKKQEPNS